MAETNPPTRTRAEVPAEARRAVHARFCADLARKHPGTIWHIEDADETPKAPADELSPGPSDGPGVPISGVTDDSSRHPTGEDTHG